MRPEVRGWAWTPWAGARLAHERSRCPVGFGPVPTFCGRLPYAAIPQRRFDPVALELSPAVEAGRVVFVEPFGIPDTVVVVVPST